MADILYKGSGTKPTRGSAGAAGWDLYVAEDTTLIAYQPALVATHLEIAIPEGHMLWVVPRSGNALKRYLLIPNSPGLIDEDYRGALNVLVTFMPPSDWRGTWLIKKGERIAQAVLTPYVPQNWVEVESLPETQRGSGGFGSTGV